MRQKQYYRDKYSKFWVKQSAIYEQDLSYQKYICQLLLFIDACAGQHILDCGIATGSPYALAVAKTGAVVHGIDIAEASIQQCLANFASQKLAVDCCVGDLENLPYKDKVFNTVYCLGTAWYVPDFRQALNEMCRVTIPKGKIVLEIMNLAHPSMFITYAYHKLLQSARKDQWRAYSPLYMKRMLCDVELSYQVKGFEVALPVALPIVGEYANICRHFPLFMSGLQDNRCLKYFGNKLIYICSKE